MEVNDALNGQVAMLLAAVSALWAALGIALGLIWRSLNARLKEQAEELEEQRDRAEQCIAARTRLELKMSQQQALLREAEYRIHLLEARLNPDKHDSSWDRLMMVAGHDN